jgi:hypothetical protein
MMTADTPAAKAVRPSPWTRNRTFLSLWCIVAAFGTYACMYGFRKPFTAAGYVEWGDGFKALLVTSQVLGYMLSKIIGIKVISEMRPERRAAMLLGLIGVAEAALLLFAVVPRPYKVACLFFNGLPLGMVFGLVLGFLEGRRLTEAFVAGLCASFILADGFTKSVGAWLLNSGVSEAWMPFTAGLIFLVPLVVFVEMLRRIPPPDHADVAERSERTPMTAADRWAMLRRHGLGLGLITLSFLLVTILRSIRADFAPEIWTGLGTTKQPSVFTTSEMWVALGVIVANGLVVVIRDNRRAFFAGLTVSILGFVLLIAALLGRSAGWLGGFPFMVLVGLGLYLPYVAVHTTIFERLIALTRDRGNMSFLMYLADASGYLGYVAVMFGKRFLKVEGGFLDFFTATCWVVSLASLAALIGAWIFFARRASMQSE